MRLARAGFAPEKKKMLAAFPLCPVLQRGQNFSVAAGQIALFNLFNRLRTNGGRLLTAAGQPPLQLSLREDLRTRLGWGLIFRVHALSDTEKVSALAAEARSRGLKLPAGSLDYLLVRVPRDMRSLMSFLVALDRYSLEHKRPITLPLLREVLQHSPF